MQAMEVFRLLDMQKITPWQSPHPASSPGPCGSFSCCSACSLSHAEFRPSRRRCHRVRFSSCSVLSVELTYSVGRRCRLVCVLPSSPHVQWVCSWSLWFCCDALLSCVADLVRLAVHAASPKRNLRTKNKQCVTPQSKTQRSS